MMVGAILKPLAAVRSPVVALTEKTLPGAIRLLFRSEEPSPTLVRRLDVPATLVV